MIPRPHRSSFAAPARVCGAALLLLWLAVWLCSFARDQSCLRALSWLPLWERLFVDFTGNYLCSRAWVAGDNPYQVHFVSPFPVTYGYTPQTLWHFPWCALVPSRTAAALMWWALSALIIIWGVRASLRTRTDIGLGPLDPVLGLALVLFSSPVFFELERLNCNSLVLLHVLIAVAALRARSLPGDLVAGAAIALATWTKIYPAVLIPALLVLARPRALIFTVAFVGVLGAMDVPGLRQFWHHRRETAPIHHPSVHGTYDNFMHPLGAWWILLWEKAGVSVFRRIPEPLVAALLLAPFLVAATRPILNLPVSLRSKLTLPYFLWLVSAGTFMLPIANDYNLLFLPLALLAVVGPTRTWTLPVLFALSLLWLQPFAIPINGFLMTVLKLCCLAAASVGLRARAVAFAGAPS